MKLTRVTSEEVEEWSALYVDGKLNQVGDSYLIDERIRELVKVDEIDGNFLLGGNSYDDAAQTLEEIEAYENAREVESEEADELEAQAAEILAKAAALRARK